VIALTEQIAEVKLELKFRLSVYTKLVATGKMKQATMDFRMARMQAVLETLEQLLVKPDDSQGRMHDG